MKRRISCALLALLTALSCLGIPALAELGVSFSGGNMSWNALTGADTYYFRVDDLEAEIASGTSVAIDQYIDQKILEGLLLNTPNHDMYVEAYDSVNIVTLETWYGTYAYQSPNFAPYEEPEGPVTPLADSATYDAATGILSWSEYSNRAKAYWYGVKDAATVSAEGLSANIHEFLDRMVTEGSVPAAQSYTITLYVTDRDGNVLDQWETTVAYAPAVTLIDVDDGTLALTGIEDSYTATGSPIEPVPSMVAVQNVVMEQGTDFTLSYEDNVAPGTGYVVVKGIGLYTGTAKVPFTIVAAPTAAPTTAPTAQPTASPTAAPTAAPTAQPTATSTAVPTAAPTQAPAEQPTEAPTTAPTQAPVEQPTAAPTEQPAQEATQAPVEQPIEQSAQVTQAPVEQPSEQTGEQAGEQSPVQPTEQTVEQATEQPAEAPAEQPAPAAKVKLSDCKFSVKDQVYTGKALKPAVTAKYGGAALAAGTDYTASYKNNKKVGTATVTLKGKGRFTGSVKLTFKIAPKATALSKLAPGSKQLTVQWKKQASQVTGYQLQYATKKSFKGGKLVTVKGAKSVKTTLKKLKGGTTYYVRVRTYTKVGKTTYYSAWSKPKSAKTKK